MDLFDRRFQPVFGCCSKLLRFSYVCPHSCFLRLSAVPFSLLKRIFFWPRFSLFIGFLGSFAPLYGDLKSKYEGIVVVFGGILHFVLHLQGRVFPFHFWMSIGGMAGLAVTYGLTLNARQSRWILSLCKLENRIISIERIQQYSCIPSEAPLMIENSQPSASWPFEGTVDIVNLQVKYKENLPKVLHGITCTFLGGKKIGIVGRTGSGKSTLIQALFRMVEPVDGRIVIDGLDISTIGLHDLRSRLGIIPQDPTLFEGTIRFNLDPLEEHSDNEIWEALDKCQLGDLVREKEAKLDSLVTENGENWSVGQRQLVSLGRALLKQARILVLDEATASVDTATDGVIQRTIRAEFLDCTVISIAHRIPTVIDSDQVLVLSDGRVAEFDTPLALLENKSSLFFKLVSEYSMRSSSVSDMANMS